MEILIKENNFEIDRKKYGKYYRCGNRGYYANNCGKEVDVGKMMRRLEKQVKELNQWKEEMEERMEYMEEELERYTGREEARRKEEARKGYRKRMLKRRLRDQEEEGNCTDINSII